MYNYIYFPAVNLQGFLIPSYNLHVLDKEGLRGNLHQEIRNELQPKRGPASGQPAMGIAAGKYSPVKSEPYCIIHAHQ